MVGALTVTVPSCAIEDRASAIRYAASIAQLWDTVLILGNGHENGQDIKGAVTPFDDRIELEQAIEARP
jgi:UDP-N-acetylmuramoyl-L-alanyl-D-glutamate--2,6-diaminopimelate ligase